MRIYVVSTLCVVAAMAFSATAEAGSEVCYEVENINFDDGNPPSTGWWDINGSGDMAGNYCVGDTCDEAWWEAVQPGVIYDATTGEIETFSAPDGYDVVGWLGMNDHGVLAGQAIVPADGGYNSVGFLYEDGESTVFDNPLDYGKDYFATDINNAGTMVGASSCVDGSCDIAGWMMDKHGDVSLVEVENAVLTVPYGIANNGSISGAFLGYDDDLDLYYVGAFLLDKHGDVATLSDYGGTTSREYYANRHNAKGTVVGTYYEWDEDGNLVDQGGFVWDGGEDVLSYHVDGFGAVGFNGINASGVIAASANDGWDGLRLTPGKCD